MESLRSREKQVGNSPHIPSCDSACDSQCDSSGSMGCKECKRLGSRTYEDWQQCLGDIPTKTNMAVMLNFFKETFSTGLKNIKANHLQWGNWVQNLEVKEETNAQSVFLITGKND